MRPRAPAAASRAFSRRRRPAIPRRTRQLSPIRASLSTNRHDWCMTFEDRSENQDSGPAETGGPRPRVIDGGKGLVATRIGKSFNKRPVVRSVSLSVRRGEVVGLLGPNGAGKTTCFYMISGLISADTGSIEVDGHDVTLSLIHISEPTRQAEISY